MGNTVYDDIANGKPVSDISIEDLVSGLRILALERQARQDEHSLLYRQYARTEAVLECLLKSGAGI